MTPIRVMVVDDHSIVREGIRHILSDTGIYSVVGEASSAAQAVETIEALAPDVVILDVSMPGRKGIHVVAELIARVPAARILMLSVHDDSEYVLESVRAGAHGYVRKDSTPAETSERDFGTPFRRVVLLAAGCGRPRQRTALHTGREDRDTGRSRRP